MSRVEFNYTDTTADQLQLVKVKLKLKPDLQFIHYSNINTKDFET